MAENNKSILDYDDIIKKTDAFDVLFVELDKFEKKIKKIAKLLQKDLQLINPNDTKAIQNHTKEVAKLERANAKLKAEKEKAVKARKKLIDLTNEELIALQKEKAAARERNAIAKQTAIIQANGAKSIAGLRAQLSLTTIQWKKLTAEEATNTTKGKNLVATKRNLTKELKRLERATGDNRRNVGNYTDALIGLDSVLGGTIGRLTLVARSLKTVASSLKRNVGALKSFKVALAATGIGALVLVFASLVTFLTKTQRGLDLVNQAFTAVGAAIDVIIDRISKFGEAIGAAFSGDFSRAAELFKESVSGIGEEIARESAAALQLERDLQALEKRRISLIVVNEKRRIQISELRREAEELAKRDSKAAAERIKQAIEVQTAISDSELKIAQERSRIANERLSLSESTNEEIEEAANLEKEALRVEKDRNDQIRSLIRKYNTLTGTQEKATKVAIEQDVKVNDSLKLRIKAIEDLQATLLVLETRNIKDRQERLLALEDLRLKEEQALAAKRFEDFKKIEGVRASEILAFEGKIFALSEQQLIASEKRKVAIRKQFALETKELAVIELPEEEQQDLIESIKETQKAVQKANEQAIKDKQDRVAKEKELTKELLSDINKLSVQSSKVIQEVFSNQAKASAKAVEEQLNAVEQAEERARLGLTNNLKFEQEQLAKRQAEQQRALKAQKQAADALALVQLTIAAAQNGDPKAVATAVTQFGILKGLEAAITGSFFEGTEDTGKGGNMDIRKGMLSILHPHERVVSRRENEQLKGISNKELPTFANIGRDFLEGNLTLDASHFRGQAHDISPGVLKKENNKEVINELKEVKRAIKSIPVVDTKIEELYGKVLEFSKKTTNRHVSRIEKTRVSL